jgi:hypothetical protein
VQRRDFDLLSARLANDFVVDTNQMIAKLGEFGAIAFIGARRQPIFLDAPHPADVVVVGAAAPGAGVTRRPRFRFVDEERAFIQCHGRVGGSAGGQVGLPIANCTPPSLWAYFSVQ